MRNRQREMWISSRPLFSHTGGLRTLGGVLNVMLDPFFFSNLPHEWIVTKIHRTRSMTSSEPQNKG